MERYKILLIIATLILGIIGLHFLVDFNFAYFYIIFFLIFPLASIADLIEFYFGSKNQFAPVLEGKKTRIFTGYFIPLAGLFYILGFLYRREIYWNENFTPSQIKLIDIFIGIGAVISLIGQIAHLLISLNSKFISFKFRTYLILFFLSYITCGLSFAILYHLDMEHMKLANSPSRTIDIIYFSFVTLATTGYGDITPASTITKLYVILENMLGLFLTGYVVTMIFSSYKK